MQWGARIHISLFANAAARSTALHLPSELGELLGLAKQVQAHMEQYQPVELKGNT